MKEWLHNLDKAFESRVRLGIMSVLMVNDRVDFNTMKETLDVSDGNLASHVGALEQLGYVKVTKKFIGKKPNTSYAATAAGKQAFQEHLAALEKMLKDR
ncbi:MAG: transcriptional regulator [Flavobacteriales bacterium]|nr:transcriptional regulator [Flavobacteriales bacterium]MCB9448211.1 transcriptional regulator [Flavobacteriales bacterium]